jgi:hypothetical protein
MSTSSSAIFVKCNDRLFNWQHIKYISVTKQGVPFINQSGKPDTDWFVHCDQDFRLLAWHDKLIQEELLLPPSTQQTDTR